MIERLNFDRSTEHHTPGKSGPKNQSLQHRDLTKQMTMKSRNTIHAERHKDEMVALTILGVISSVILLYYFR